jgi:hypothetical protein
MHLFYMVHTVVAEKKFAAFLRNFLLGRESGVQKHTYHWSYLKYHREEKMQKA